MDKQTIGYLYNRIQFSNIKEESTFIRCKNTYETKKMLGEIVKEAELIHDGNKSKQWFFMEEQGGFSQVYM